MIVRLGPVAIVLVSVIVTSCSSGGKPKLPFGGVNVPVSSQRLVGKSDLTGWALAEAGIESVSIYLDRSFVSNSNLGLPRPDVAQAHPNVSGSGNAGWKFTLDTAKFPPGWHELTIQAKSKEGAIHDLASVPVLIER